MAKSCPKAAKRAAERSQRGQEQPKSSPRVAKSGPIAAKRSLSATQQKPKATQDRPRSAKVCQGRSRLVKIGQDSQSIWSHFQRPVEANESNGYRFYRFTSSHGVGVLTVLTIQTHSTDVQYRRTVQAYSTDAQCRISVAVRASWDLPLLPVTFSSH